MTCCDQLCLLKYHFHFQASIKGGEGIRQEMSEATSLRDSGGLDYGNGSEDGGHWVDGPENQLGGRINRQVINWMFEERKSKLMPSWEWGRIHHPMQSVWFLLGQDRKVRYMYMQSTSACGVLQWEYLVNIGVFESGVWREAGILDLGAIGTQMVIDSWE